MESEAGSRRKLEEERKLKEQEEYYRMVANAEAACDANWGIRADASVAEL